MEAGTLPRSKEATVIGDPLMQDQSVRTEYVGAKGKIVSGFDPSLEI